MTVLAELVDHVIGVDPDRDRITAAVVSVTTQGELASATFPATRQPTIDYVARRTAEGMSKREIIRCLKRCLAREIFRLLPAPDAIANPVDEGLEIAA